MSRICSSYDRRTVASAGFASVSSINSALTGLWAQNLPDDYYQQYTKRIAAITKDDVLRVARQYVTVDKLDIVIVGDRKVIESNDRPVEAEVTGEFNGGQAEARAKAGPGFLEAFGSVENQGPQPIHTLFSATAVDEVDDLIFSSPPGSSVEELLVRLNLHLEGTFGFDAANDDLQTAFVRAEQTGYGSANNFGYIEIIRRDG